MMNRLLLIFSIFLTIGCDSSGDKKHVDTELSDHDSLKKTTTDTNSNAIPIDYSDSVNFRDSNGLKQGQWIKMKKGKLVEKYTYVNDTLNGRYVHKNTEGSYKDGKREGLRYWYSENKESLVMVVYYSNDSSIWSGFPAAGRCCVIPLKDFHIDRDSIYIKAPYVNGNLWYEGHFCFGPKDEKDTRALRYGVHKIYHLNGKIKGLVNYDKKTFTEYDSLGNLLFQGAFDNLKDHFVGTLGRY